MSLSPKHEAIIEALREGPVEDERGSAVRKLLERAKTHNTTQALSSALKDLEEQGLIEREVNVRRTYRIALVNGAEPAAEVAPFRVPAPTVDDSGVDSSEPSVDYQRLAEAVFTIAVRNLRDREELGDAKQWMQRALKAEARVESLRDERDDARRKASSAEAQVAALEKNISTVMAQLDRAERQTRGGYKLREHLDEGSRAALESLMRSMPAGTKGRDEVVR